MSSSLNHAQRYFDAGQFKKAVAALWEVKLTDDTTPDEARGLLELATALREKTDGRLRSDCEFQMRRAKELLAALQPDPLRDMKAAFAEDPVRLARWAAEADLSWLQVESADNLVGLAQEAAMAAAVSRSEGHSDQCLVDAIEAEGWKLENAQQVFRPTKLQTSPARGAEFLMGADVVEGETSFVYLFRRTASRVG